MGNDIWTGAGRPMSPGAFARAAGVIGCDEAVIRAVWSVESSGRAYRPDGSLTRRFEPHHMPGSKLDWRDSKALSTSQRERLFGAAILRDAEAAYRATSWGAPQIMGFNAAAAGYVSATEMVRAFAASEDAQIEAFVAMVTSWGLAGALRARDWPTIAKRYNGAGNVAVYAGRLEDAYRAETGQASQVVLRPGSNGASVAALQRALGIEDDGAFGQRTESAVRAFQAARGLAADGVVGAKTWDALAVIAEAAPTEVQAKISQAADVAKTATALVGAVSAAVPMIQALTAALPPLATVALAGGAAACAVVWVAGRAFGRRTA